MRTVLFVHGMFVTPLCWKEWETLFQSRGMKTLAPAWPEHDQPVAAQRRGHPNPRLGALTLGDMVSHHRGIISGLGEKPILIGHSMGGLIVQLLLQEDLGVAGIAIDSAPPKGLISLRWSFLKSNWPAVSPFAPQDEPVLLTLEQFSYAFVNTLPEQERRAAYEAHVVPESRRVGKGPTTDAAAIDFQRRRAPLLLIAGEKDHIIPASLNRSNFERYGGSSAVTHFKEFAGRDHWIIAAPGWQEVAEHSLAWLQENLPR